MLLRLLKSWHRNYILRHHAIDTPLWEQVIPRLPLLAGLKEEELIRLRELTTLFLHKKNLETAGEMELNDDIAVTIASQACLPILNLGLEYYRGWTSIIVYPQAFVAEHDELDSAGVIHRVRRVLSGESWLRGPVVLAWSDIEHVSHHHPSHNVIVHELAHKLDMLNGAANGMPPLHADMSRHHWTDAFSKAYEHFLSRHKHPPYNNIDAYAAEGPAEFFAVISEYFFTTPRLLTLVFPEVYEQLTQFYRQDPSSRTIHPA